MVSPVTKGLSTDAWIESALDLLRENGVEAVRVEPLARLLGVTKGSFYWHFRDRSMLESAILDVWDERSTTAILAQVAGPEPAEVRLRRLGRLVTDAAEPGQLLENNAGPVLQRDWDEASPKTFGHV